MGIFGRLRKTFGRGGQGGDSSAQAGRPVTPSDQPSPKNRAVFDAVGFVLANDTPANRDRLYQAISTSELLIPCDQATAARAIESGEFKHNDEMNLMVIRNPQGQMILPVFTDEDALTLWSAKVQAYLWMDGANLLNLIKSNGTDALAINPAGPAGGVIDGEHLRNLLTRLDPQTPDA